MSHALALVAALVLDASAAAVGGGVSPATHAPDLAIDCWAHPVEPHLYFDGRCRDHHWLMGTLGDRADREIVEVHGPKGDQDGSSIIIHERDLDDDGLLYITALTSDSLRPFGPTRAGYAVLATWTIQTAWDADYASYIQEHTIREVQRHPSTRWSLGGWTNPVIFHQEVLLTPDYYASTGSDVRIETLCASRGHRVSSQARTECLPNAYDYLSAGSLVAGTGIAVGAIGVGIVAGPEAFGAAAGSTITWGAVAKLSLGVAGLTGGAIAFIDTINERSCDAAATVTYHVAYNQCLEDHVDEPDDEEPTEGPDRPDDRVPTDFDDDFGCAGMQVPQQVTEVREHCYCESYAYTEPSSDPEFDEEMVVGLRMACDTQSSTTTQCCDPGMQDCSPAEVDLGTNADELVCH